MSDNSLIAALRKAARQASSKPEDRIEWKAADRIEALSPPQQAATDEGVGQ